ncbi:hypothetical protein FACS1894105_07060 [Clostridia bacterium]|nr:hypothetical protein FACS1894105_07060 [Clostridia bacterium]
MKRSFFAALLAVSCLMSLFVASGCNSSGAGLSDIEPPRVALTLTLYTITDDRTTPEALAEVAKKLSSITEQKLTTRLNIVALKESEYQAAIDAHFEAYDAKLAHEKELASIEKASNKAARDKLKRDKAAGITQASTKRPTEPPATTQFYTEKLIYPVPEANEIDIFLVNSTSMFEGLLQNDRLQALDDELSTKAKILREYINPAILLGGSYNDRVMAIPTNKAVGEITFFAVNKRLAEKYNLDLSPYTTAENPAKPKFSDFTNFLTEVKAGDPDVKLLDAPLEPIREYELLFPEYPYFNLVARAGTSAVYTPARYSEGAYPLPEYDTNGELVPTEIAPTSSDPKMLPAKINSVGNVEWLTMSSQYSSSDWKDYAMLNSQYRELGLFETSPIPAGAERAYIIKKGTLADLNAWKSDPNDPYEYIVYDKAHATRDDIQSGMYAIPVSSVKTARAMEVITLLNTNKEFKNTFQYGVEGTHFIHNDDGAIEIISNEYIMDMNHTGNHFVADVEVGEDPNKWEINKQHNLDLLYSDILGFFFDRKQLSEASVKAFGPINDYSVKIRQDLLSGNMPPEVEGDYDAWTKLIKQTFDSLGNLELLENIKEQTYTPHE